MAMTRERAHEILHKYMEGERYLEHSYAVEAIMRGVAAKLAPDEVEYWGIVGLLHDLDEEHCPWKEHPETHGPTSVEILKKEGVEDPVLFDAICAHNPESGVKAKTKLQYAILACDPMSGFLKAIAQIYPDKKIASVKHKSVQNDSESTVLRQALTGITWKRLSLREWILTSLLISRWKQCGKLRTRSGCRRRVLFSVSIIIIYIMDCGLRRVRFLFWTKRWSRCSGRLQIYCSISPTRFY